MFRVWKYPAFLGSPVVGAINNTTKIVGRTVFGQFDNAHCHLIADAAPNDWANNFITRLNDPILEPNLATAVAIRGTAKPSLNRRNTRCVATPNLGKAMLRWPAGMSCRQRYSWLHEDCQTGTEDKRFHAKSLLTELLIAMAAFHPIRS